MKVLFVTRAYPPFIGGMEKFASEFYTNYKKNRELDILANPKGKKYLASFFIKVFFYIIFNGQKYDIIHIYDAVLSPLILAVRLFTKAKVTFTVNGLDIVYSKFGYQKYMPFFLGKADKIFAISHHTMDQCVARGILPQNMAVIPVGFNFEDQEISSDNMKSSMQPASLRDLSNSKILLTIGRLVERKGHTWFIKNVFIDLPQDYSYVIAGDGPEKAKINKLVTSLGLEKRVRLLGRIEEEEKRYLLQNAYLFVMPNVSIRNDQEGFGIVLLEAAQYSLPVVASKIEGIRDVVVDGKTAKLVEEKDIKGFINAILSFNPDRAEIFPVIMEKFNWDRVISMYIKFFDDLIHPVGR